MTEVNKTWEEMSQEPGSVIIGPASFFTKVLSRNDEWVGIHEWHKNKDGKLCGGWVPFDVPGLDEFYRKNAWRVVSLDPLHIEPSLLCGCGNHGFIWNGKWEPC